MVSGSVEEEAAGLEEKLGSVLLLLSSKLSELLPSVTVGSCASAAEDNSSEDVRLLSCVRFRLSLEDALLLLEDMLLLPNEAVG